MKKSIIASALALSMGTGIAHAVDMNSGTFTMLSPPGGNVGTFPDVTGDIGGGSWGVASTSPFFGFTWTAHSGTTFGPGTYTFDTLEGGIYTNVVVGAGQAGGHILFDWNTTTNIDVINVWDVVCTTAECTYTSTDVTAGAGTGANTPITAPDGIRGLSMIDGSFPQFNANFDFAIAAPPTAVDDAKSTPADTPTTIDLVANDFAAVTNPAPSLPNVAVSPAAVGPAFITIPANTTQGGTLADQADGSVLYTPPAGYNGPDSFTYTLTDDAGRVSAAATVSITVTLVANTPPVANDAAVSTNEDTPTDIGVNSVSSDADGDSLVFAAFDAASTQGGTVTVDVTNTVLTYTPATDFNGTDTFTYSVTDGVDTSNTATISVTVNPINDALVCTDVTLFASVDTPLAISVDSSLLSTCNDPDVADTITLASTTQPTQPGSTLSDDGAGTLTYTPATGFEGQDSFTYTATDGALTDTKTVTINVTGKIFGNFTMLAADGITFGGTNDIVFTWDGTCYNSVAEADAGPANMTMGSDSSALFFGFSWFAHDIKVYCPGGPYIIDTCNPGATPPACGDLVMTVPPDHLGGHILFDWNKTTDIDVASVWNNTTGGTWQNVVPGGLLYQGPTGPTPALDEFYDWIVTDGDGDGVPGIRFTDGPFIDFRANFSFKTTQGGGGTVTAPESSVSSPNLGSTAGCTLGTVSTNPLNRSDWLIIGGLLVLLGFGRPRRQRIR